MFVKGAALLLFKITVVIYNSEAVPERELVRGETVAGQILRRPVSRYSGVRQRRPTRPSAPGRSRCNVLAAHPPNLQSRHQRIRHA